MKRIVAAIDDSEFAERVLECAASLSKTVGARLWLVHVAPPDPDFVGLEAGPQSVRDQTAAELRAQHRSLQARAEQLRGRDIDATALLVRGPTVDTLLAEAEKLAADLIVLGSHGRTGAMRLLLGSVSEGVLRRCAIPVMVIPPERRSR